MKNESLEEALDACISSICKLDIDDIDKVELLLNLRNFLSVSKYQHNIKVLEKDRLYDRSH